MIDNVKNKIGNIYRNIVTSVAPLAKESKFYEKGVLTPEEFILAGDQLTKACPSWQWKPAVAAKYENPAFPADKQFLTSKARSERRIKDLYREDAREKDMEDDWVLTESNQTNSNKSPNLNINTVKKDYFEAGDQSQKNSEEVKTNEASNNDIIKVVQEEPDTIRYYDISITYDFYYLTPRFWLSGYDTKPLTNEEIFEDIMSEYANKTVTFEEHPYLGVKQASIHPCRHPEVIKYLIETITQNGGKLEVYQALFVFLKFMGSVMPTIEYDFTVDIVLE